MPEFACPLRALCLRWHNVGGMHAGARSCGDGGHKAPGPAARTTQRRAQGDRGRRAERARCGGAAARLRGWTGAQTEEHSPGAPTPDSTLALLHTDAVPCVPMSASVVFGASWLPCRGQAVA